MHMDEKNLCPARQASYRDVDCRDSYLTLPVVRVQRFRRRRGSTLSWLPEEITPTWLSQSSP